MKSIILKQGVAIVCVIGLMAAHPVFGQNSATGHNSPSSAGAGISGTADEAGGSETSSGTTQSGQPAENSAIDNHAPGTANNQTHTGGNDAQRRSGGTEDRKLK